MGESVSSNRALIRRMRGRSAFLFNCPFGIYCKRRIKAEVDEAVVLVGEAEGRDFFVVGNVVSYSLFVEDLPCGPTQTALRSSRSVPHCAVRKKNFGGSLEGDGVF